MAGKIKLADLIRNTAAVAATRIPDAPTTGKPATATATPRALPPAPVVGARLPDGEVARQKSGKVAGEVIAQLRLRAFVAELVKNGFKAADAYMSVFACTKKVAHNRAHDMLRTQKGQEELHRQLRSIAVLDEVTTEYLFRQMRSIAEASLFDYISVKDGKLVYNTLNSDTLTAEQRINIREISFDQYGNIRKIKLASRERALDMLNQAKGLYNPEGPQNEAANIAQLIRSRMQAAQKRIPERLTIDHETQKVLP